MDKVIDNIKNCEVKWDQIEIGIGDNKINPDAKDLIDRFLEPNP